MKTVRSTSNRRKGTRVAWVRPVIIETEWGDTILGHTTILSLSGVGIRTATRLEKGETIRINFLIDGEWIKVNAKVVYSRVSSVTTFKRLNDTGIAFKDSNAGSQLWLKSHGSREDVTDNEI